jgi:hypothetical protein
MFGGRYFNVRYFNARYFAASGATVNLGPFVVDAIDWHAAGAVAWDVLDDVRRVAAVDTHQPGAVAKQQEPQP